MRPLCPHLEDRGAPRPAAGRVPAQTSSQTLLLPRSEPGGKDTLFPPPLLGPCVKRVDKRVNE